MLTILRRTTHRLRRKCWVQFPSEAVYASVNCIHYCTALFGFIRHFILPFGVIVSIGNVMCCNLNGGGGVFAECTGNLIAAPQ